MAQHTSPWSGWVLEYWVRRLDMAFKHILIKLFLFKTYGICVLSETIQKKYSSIIIQKILIIKIHINSSQIYDVHSVWIQVDVSLKHIWIASAKMASLRAPRA